MSLASLCEIRLLQQHEIQSCSGRPNDHYLTGHWPTINKVAGLLMILAAIAEALTSALETIIHLDNR